MTAALTAGDIGAGGAAAGPPLGVRRRGRVRLAAAALGAAALAAAALSAPRWAPAALARLSFFRVRQVEVHGAAFTPAAELVARLGVDTTATVWRDLAPLAARVGTHPMVARAEVGRRLPGVLVLRVAERRPVAAVPTGAGLRYFDSAGVALPLPPTAGVVDVPLVAAPDTALLRALGALRTASPAAYARVSEVRRVRPARGEGGRAAAARPEFVFALAPADSSARAVVVRAGADVTAAQFADAALVERDLARRGVPALELDLRFRDQVVARLP